MFHFLGSLLKYFDKLKINMIFVALAFSTANLFPVKLMSAPENSLRSKEKTSLSKPITSDNSFDFYAFSQLWWPEKCYANQNAAENCTYLDKNTFLGTNLKACGFWPTKGDYQQVSISDNLEKLFGTNRDDFLEEKPMFAPAYCSQNTLSKKDLSDDLKLKLKNIGWVNFKFLNHEWQKHGTCSLLSKEQYFTKFLEFDTQFVTPEVVHQNIGGQVYYQDLEAAYGGKDCVLIKCATYKDYHDQQYLSSIIIAISKDKLEQTCKYLSSYPNESMCDRNKPINIRKISAQSIIN